MKCNTQYTKKCDIQWRRRAFESDVNTVNFDENVGANDISDISTPIKYFEKYFTDEVFEKFAFHTNMYVNQNNSTGFRTTNASEMKTLFGLHMLMECLKFSRIRMYWSPVLNIEIFKQHMTSDRFFQLRNNLHIVNNLEKR